MKLYRCWVCLTLLIWLQYLLIVMTTLCKVQEAHRKKLHNLRCFWIINFSSYQLNDVEKSLLANGLDFALPPRILNRTKYLLPFKMVYIDLKTMEVLSNDTDIIKVAFKEYVYNSFKEFSLSGDEYNALKNLPSLKNIITQKLDKENSAVLIRIVMIIWSNEWKSKHQIQPNFKNFRWQKRRITPLCLKKKG